MRALIASRVIDTRVAILCEIAQFLNRDVPYHTIHKPILHSPLRVLRFADVQT
jgi:hypothetical protein